MRPQLTALIVVASLVSAQADDQVRATQEELRRRNIYFGDIDGRASPELQEAMKRYQKRKGFSTSGQSDPDTLRSLGLLARQPGEEPPKQVAWPAEPVLRSDVRIDVAQEAGRVAEESGVAPASIFPLIAISGRNGENGRTSGRGTSPRVRQTPAPAPAPAVAARGRASRAGRTDQRIEPAELRAFVAGYFAAVSGGDLQKELGFYADRVNYYHAGSVDRRIIERTLRDFALLWPKRSYRLAGPVSFRRDPARGEIIAVCRVDFTQRRKGSKVEGQTESRIVINAATADPRIVRIEERRVRGE